MALYREVTIPVLLYVQLLETMTGPRSEWMTSWIGFTFRRAQVSSIGIGGGLTAPTPPHTTVRTGPYTAVQWT